MPPEQLGPPPHGDCGSELGVAGGVRLEETVIAAISLAILTNGPSIAISHLYNVPLGWDRWPYMVPMGSIALIGVFLCGRDLRLDQLRRFRWAIGLVAAYTAWSLASVTWSVAADQTAVRALVTAGVSAVGLWYGLCLRFKEQVLAVFGAAAVLCLWSLGLILLQPKTHQIYPSPSHPNWHTEVFGVFGNPNSLGPVAALAVLSAIAVWILFPLQWARATACVIAAVGILLTFWSQCETAIGGLALALLVVSSALLLPFLRRLSGWIVGGTLVVSIPILWRVFFDHIDRIAPIIGADAMLSSRRVIWLDVRNLIALRPWRGYGFFAFWDNETMTAATYHNLGSAYGSAHNSVLEVALGLGRIGLAIYVAMALVMVVGIARSIWFKTDLPRLAWVAMVLFLIAQNSMESFVLWHSYLWAIFVAATVVPYRLGGFDG
jgi:O-antigen ligase